MRVCRKKVVHLQPTNKRAQALPYSIKHVTNPFCNIEDMKQLLFIALAVFIVFSCTYEDIDYQVQPSQNSEVVISLSQDNAIIKARSFM